jgi:hypothetical protein
MVVEKVDGRRVVVLTPSGLRYVVPRGHLTLTETNEETATV